MWAERLITYNYKRLRRIVVEARTKKFELGGYAIFGRFSTPVVRYIAFSCRWFGLIAVITRIFCFTPQKENLAGLIDSLCLASHSYLLVLYFCAGIIKLLDLFPVSLSLFEISFRAAHAFALSFLALQAPSSCHSASTQCLFEL